MVVEVVVSEGFKDLLNLYLYGDGERLLYPKVQEVVASEQLQLVTFLVPSVLRDQLVPDEVGVALRGKCDLGAIASISFVNGPLSTFVPPAGGRGVVERIGTHGLRSFGLIGGQALETECSVDELRGCGGRGFDRGGFGKRNQESKHSGGQWSLAPCGAGSGLAWLRRSPNPRSD